MCLGFQQFIQINATDALRLGNRDVSSSALTTSSASNMEKQRSLTQPTVEQGPARFIVLHAHHCALREPLSFHPTFLRVVVRRKVKSAKVCFGKQNVKFAEKHIGRTILGTFVLTVRNAKIPHNRIFQIFMKSLNIKKYIDFER